MDFDHDGCLDLLSGSWPGEVFLFRGGKGHSFAAPEMLKDKDGEIINIGGGIRDGHDGMMLIAGSAEFESTPEGTFVTYQGERFESTPDRPIGITGTASTAHAADWDGDGDHDLIIGDIRGNVYLVVNEGTPERHAFSKERELLAAGSPIHAGREAGPFAADWDGDGDLDLLVGGGDGSVSLFRNTGTAASPELAEAEQLITPGAPATHGPEAPKEVRRGTSSKICAADWNGDGRLDLLVGDATTQKPDLPEPTPEEKARHAKIREELESLSPRAQELRDKLYGPNRAQEKDEEEKYRKEWAKLRDRMQELRSKLPPEYERHGWVWLFLRTDRERGH